MEDKFNKDKKILDGNSLYRPWRISEKKKNEFVNSIKEAYKKRYKLFGTVVMYLRSD